jgi:hypothetical protein
MCGTPRGTSPSRPTATGSSRCRSSTLTPGSSSRPWPGRPAPSPLVSTYSYNAIGNLTYKSDVGAYNYPAPGQARPHAVTSVSGGSINATFTYDLKGNLIAGNGLSIT